MDRKAWPWTFGGPGRGQGPIRTGPLMVSPLILWLRCLCCHVLLGYFTCVGISGNESVKVVVWINSSPCRIFQYHLFEIFLFLFLFLIAKNGNFFLQIQGQKRQLALYAFCTLCPRLLVVMNYFFTSHIIYSYLLYEKIVGYLWPSKTFDSRIF